MIASLMAYVLIASLLLAIGGWGVESLLRSVRLPARFVWTAALVGTTALAIAAPLRTGEAKHHVRELAGANELQPPSLSMVGEAPLLPGASVALASMRSEVQKLLELPITLAARIGAEGAWKLRFLWIALSLSLLGMGVATALRYRVARRSWPLKEVEGIRVRVSPETGPAVMGILHPEIVVPHWLLESAPEERRLALLHEGEHLRAGDSFTLALGCAVLALFPWNPTVWWMLSRLRLAMEVDCDTRVLNRGIEEKVYGSMLIDVSGHRSGVSLGVPALSGSPSTLERRLIAMTMKNSRAAILRGGAVGTLGIIAVVAACDAGLPTAAEIEAMGTEAALVELEVAGVGLPAEEVRFFQDGIEITRAEAAAIRPEVITSIQVNRDGSVDGWNEVVMVTTGRRLDGSTNGAAGEGSTRPEALNFQEIEVVGYRRPSPLPLDESGAVEMEEIEVVGYGLNSAGTPAPLLRDLQEVEVEGRNMGEPLYLIDNVPATTAEFNNLRPEDIGSISILKDASAAVYGNRAANGVVLIVTKVAQLRSRLQAEDYYEEVSRNAPTPTNVVP